MPQSLPKLSYNYNALEPVIDAMTMEIHHSKHHAAYVDKLNAALEGVEDWKNEPVEDILRNINEIPSDVRQSVINNGGGHANHTLFWEILTPGGSKDPTGELLEKINSTFTDLADLKEKMNTAGTSRFGSGWTWLVISNGNLEVYSTANQDSPLMEGKTPILGIDVWEHAYYLKYQNKRPDYLTAIWEVINWTKVEKLFSQTK